MQMSYGGTKTEPGGTLRRYDLIWEITPEQFPEGQVVQTI